MADSCCIGTVSIKVHRSEFLHANTAAGMGKPMRGRDSPARSTVFARDGSVDTDVLAGVGSVDTDVLVGPGFAVDGSASNQAARAPRDCGSSTPGERRFV